MKVLITGITGYIGSHLARELLPGHEVYGLVREPVKDTYISSFREQVTLLPYDGTQQSLIDAIRQSQPELTYHLAAYYTGSHGAEHTPKLVESNLVLGAYLLEALANLDHPLLVYASTVMAHYQGEAYRPLNLYAATKRAFSDLLAYYTDAGMLRAATLILSDTYGAGDRRPKVLNLIRAAARRGERMGLTNGEQDYDAVYIDDVIRAFMLTGRQLKERTSWRNESFQIYAENPTTLRETVKEIQTQCDPKLEVEWGKKPQPEREIRRAIRLYPKPPGWEPEVPLSEGLHRLWQEP